MKIGKKNINRFFPNYVNREKEIKEHLVGYYTKIIYNSMYGSNNYIVCNSSLIKTLKDAIDK